MRPLALRQPRDVPSSRGYHLAPGPGRKDAASDASPPRPPPLPPRPPLSPGSEWVLTEHQLNAALSNIDVSRIVLAGGTYEIVAPIVVNRALIIEACDTWDSSCQNTEASCKQDPTDNTDSCNALIDSVCMPVTFNQRMPL